MCIELNSNQITAINHNKGPMLVLSGPGSGKTTVITYRVKNLIEKFNVNPNDIIVISFTKAATKEMKDRFLKICENKQVTFATFHSYFFTIIKNHYSYDLKNIMNENEKINIIKKIIYELNINFDNEEEFLQNISNEISLVKNELFDINLFDSKFTNSNSFKQIFLKYEDIKKNMQKIDFDDMLLKCYNLITQNEYVKNRWQNRYKYILIDEFQDINKIQYECIKMLLNNEKNIFVVGDDDQSIYGFRGSSPKFLIDFPKNFDNTKIVILNTNYRSTEQIIKLCNNVIIDNKNRYFKNINGSGINYKAPILLRCYDTNEEAEKITKKILELKKTTPLEQIAIIYRTNMQARAIIESFSLQNIKYQTKDKISTIYEHFIIKDISAYLKLSINKSDNESFIKIVNKPKRYISKILINDCIKECDENKSLLKYVYSQKPLESWQYEKINDLIFHINNLKNKQPYDAIKYILNNIGYYNYLEEYASFKKIDFKNLIEITDEFLDSAKFHKDNIEFLNYIDNICNKITGFHKNNEENQGVILTTMHSAKGLEFEVVFVISCIEGIIPHKKSKSEEEIEEERRLFYVALTRAKRLLYISILKIKHENNVKFSRFLNKLIKKEGRFK